MSNLATAESANTLVKRAVAYGAHFKQHTDRLKLDISEKSMVVPDCPAAREFNGAMLKMGIPMKTSNRGVDIGIDTTSAAARCTTKQVARIQSSASKAKRVAILAKRNHRARRLAITGVRPSQDYGHTAVGMAPSRVKACKTNIAMATGMLSPGACGTSIVKWAFRFGTYKNGSADPRVTMPLAQVRAWTDIWRRASTATRQCIISVWHKSHRILAQAVSKWHLVRGPLSATISTLLDCGWKPVQPHILAYSEQ
jgi:hypothetical protein